MKIKYLIDTILSPKIQPLDFVDRYAGIVRTINIAEGNGTETGIVKRYPLACNVTGVDCANIGIYQNLVPDDTKKSVIYWEMVSPMQNSGMTKTRDFYRKKFKGTARLVVWLNLAKLGIDNCTDSILVLPILEKEITTRGKITGGIYDGDLLWIEPLRMVNQDINTIFGKYDYNKLKNYYLYPFDFFAIDVQFTLEQCLSKGGTFPILPAADCQNIVPTSETCKSLLFDGVNESINCGNNVAFDLERTDSFSISTWVKIQSYPLLFSPVVAKFDRAIRRGLQLGIESDGRVRFILANNVLPVNYIYAQTNIPLSLNVWYNIIVTYNGSSDISGVKIYINGQIVSIATIGNNLSATIQNLADLNISNIDNLFFFNGNIANARIWNTELTSIQVSAEYNLGTILITPVEAANLILNTDINNATFGTQWDIPDLTGITAGYTSVNMEQEDRVEDCPNN